MVANQVDHRRSYKERLAANQIQHTPTLHQPAPAVAAVPRPPTPEPGKALSLAEQLGMAQAATAKRQQAGGGVEIQGNARPPSQQDAERQATAMQQPVVVSPDAPAPVPVQTPVQMAPPAPVVAGAGSDPLLDL